MKLICGFTTWGIVHKSTLAQAESDGRAFAKGRVFDTRGQARDHLRSQTKGQRRVRRVVKLEVFISGS